MSKKLDFLDFEGMDIGLDAARNCATLVEFHERRWHDRKRDFEGAAAAEEAAGAEAGTHEAYRKLLGKNRVEYNEVCKIITKAKKIHKKHTLPYRDGWRMLSNTNMVDYMQAMAIATKKLDKAKAEFAVVLPAIIDKARADLGNAFHDMDYPPANAIIDRFNITFDFEPLPDAGGFSNLPEGFETRLAFNLEKTVRDRLTNGMADGWAKLEGYVKHMAETLKDEEKNGFHGTLVTNVTDTLELVKHFNILGDERYDKLVSGMETHLGRYSSKDLKNNATARANTVSAAEQFLKALGDK